MNSPQGPGPKGQGHPHNPAKSPKPAGAVGATDDQVTPEDMGNPLVSDKRDGHLPTKLIFVNGRYAEVPVTDPNPPVVSIMTPEQAVDDVLGKVKDGFLKTPHTLNQALMEVNNLAFLMNGIDTTAVYEQMPFNRKQVRAGGYAALNTTMYVDEAACMKIDPDALSQDLAQNDRIEGLMLVSDTASQILWANYSHVQNRIATRVDDGLKRGDSVIQDNADLGRFLKRAIAIKGAPSDAAQVTRNERARLTEAVKTAEQEKQQGTAEATPAQLTTTVTTQAPTAPAVPSVAAPRTPGASDKAPGKKK